MATGTVNLYRVINAPAARIYRAFTDAAAIAKWMPPHGFTCTVHSLDLRVGGRYRMSFTNLDNGFTHAFGGEYLQLEPGRCIKNTDVFDDTGLPGTMITTVTLEPVSCGTAVTIVQEGIPEPVPVEQCYIGWQQSLQLLTLLVEANIPVE